jgi:hypothetical protein
LWLAALACELPFGSSSEPEIDHDAAATKRALETDVASAKETAQPGEDELEDNAQSPGVYAVMVSVSEETRCLAGPGDNYEDLGILQVGDSAEIIGRSDDGMFFYIQFPNAPPEECWIWAQYAQVDGELRELAVFTPPATPTVEPGLVVQGYVRLQDGTGVEGVTICRSFASYEGEPVATTDVEGYFQTDFSFIPGDEMVTVWAYYEGYVFDPESHFWRHYFGYELATRDFVAVPSTAGSAMPDCR